MTEGRVLCAKTPHVAPVVRGPKQKRQDSRGHHNQGELPRPYEEILLCLIETKLNLEKFVDCKSE